MKKNLLASSMLVWLLIVSLTLTLAAQQTVSLVGCGSVIPAPLYGAWGDAYSHSNPQVQIKYLPLGSGEGINQITTGSADFAAGEIPISDQELRESGKTIYQVPLFLTAVVPIYNVPGVSKRLRFSGKVLADIFAGEMKYWDHPDLVKLNPGAQLPHLAIIMVHREPAKGTTYLFTDFLSKSSPAFRAKIGISASPSWRSGLEAQGGSTMVKTVSDTPGAIGYAELNTAQKGTAGIGLVQNASGVSVEASPESTAAACPKNPKGDLRASLTNMPGENVYPITGFSWMFVSADAMSSSRAQALRGFLKFVFTDGQSMLADRGHLPLPPRIVASVQTTLKLN
ncbi:MAG TPA: phosphate ABC transporter substrate-binding protein PstS [Alphaproteobacteria bacterium]|nr:phosphate ABC transporter substrate-binding protein PstS [Alphaproteobacteria bacterium]